jgi:hypothetical protein
MCQIHVRPSSPQDTKLLYCSIMTVSRTDHRSVREVSLLVDIVDTYPTVSWPAKTEIFNQCSQLQVNGAPVRSLAALTRKYRRLSRGGLLVSIRVCDQSAPSAGPDLMTALELQSWDCATQALQFGPSIPANNGSVDFFGIRPIQTQLQDCAQTRSDMVLENRLETLNRVCTIVDPVSPPLVPNLYRSLYKSRLSQLADFHLCFQFHDQDNESFAYFHRFQVLRISA